MTTPLVAPRTSTDTIASTIPMHVAERTESVLAAADRAARRIAPVWPLKHFVAVNPFLGFTDTSFTDTAGLMARASGARMTMPRWFYAEQIASGYITDSDLHDALSEALTANEAAPDLPTDTTSLRTLAGRGESWSPELLPTVTGIASDVTGNAWAELMTERVSAWAAGYFDDGQSAWGSPWRDLSPYAAWRAEAMIDRTPEHMGLKGFRKSVARLPDDADTTIMHAVARLGLQDIGLEAWFHRLLMDVAGWASYARYLVWQSELYGNEDGTLRELLAIRLAWEVALLDMHGERSAVFDAWRRARDPIGAESGPAAGLAVDVVLQGAYEKAWQRRFFATLSGAVAESPSARSDVQAAFCIDVRSEVFRRAFERVAPSVETIGFAGFFGFPIEYVPLGRISGGAQCPVLLTPKFTVCETVQGVDDASQERLLTLRIARRRAAKAWKSFKMAAVSSFGFVETMGWTYIGKLATDAFGFTRPVPHPSADGIDAETQRKLGPRITPLEVGGRMTGFTDETRVDMAESVLKAMSMHDGFARLIMLTGHGSSTVNNPHATGLDCGACGGHTGEANARVAASILNDPAVRAGLAARGITLPDDTVFLGCLHDTTTDHVIIFDEHAVPSSHARDLLQLKQWLAEAGRLARGERAGLLNLASGKAIDEQVVARSRDWSQVRPEWGLAGCAAFIAAPRERTRGLDLGGRSFLHSYDWRKDSGFAVLELIMTAPMVVASWISLQYYGSTVDNRVFGSGNKVLHNVVGTLGVLEGNGGDLRVGLPWQSVHDGEQLIHEPLRLSVVIDAPTHAMDAIITKHESVRQLVDNGWLHLFAMASDSDSGAESANGKTEMYHYRGVGRWEATSAAASNVAA